MWGIVSAVWKKKKDVKKSITLQSRPNISWFSVAAAVNDMKSQIFLSTPKQSINHMLLLQENPHALVVASITLAEHVR